jgi:hypothetical protein
MDFRESNRATQFPQLRSKTLLPKPTKPSKPPLLAQGLRMEIVFGQESRSKAVPAFEVK